MGGTDVTCQILIYTYAVHGSIGFKTESWRFMAGSWLECQQAVDENSSTGMTCF